MKKLFISLIAMLALALTFSLVAFADIVHDETNVDYAEKVTLLDGTELPLFDENKDALIWYISGKDENGNNIYTSILAEDNQVKWYTESWDEVTSMGINFDDGTKVDNKNIVIVNLLDDDIVKNHGPGTAHYGKHIKGFKYVFRNWSNLEYVYLRLDHGGIYKESFNNCPKLQYINLEDLTQLSRIGDNYNFAGCKVLFQGQVLDLSQTKLTSIDWCDSFAAVPMVGIKFPTTLTNISGGTFKKTALVSYTHPEGCAVLNGSMFENCADLTTVYLSSKKLTGIINKDSEVYTIGNKAFLNCTSLTTVFYVGTLDELNTLLDMTSPTGNEAFFAVAGENRENLISYADYLALEDKSGKYMVYNYSWCEAYNDGNHEVTGTNPCVGFCTVCENNIVKHAEGAETTYTVEYTSYGEAGKKITTCTNEGCTYKVTEELDALIVCLGFSTPESGEGIVTVGYSVNQAAIDEYTRLTGEAVKYGLFAALKTTLGDSDLIDENGEIIDGVISAEMPENKFSILSLKMFGFDTDIQKQAEFTIGAYVVASGEDESRVDYIQDSKFGTGGKYAYVSFNTVFEASTKQY